jgi:hypothetical protein
MISLKAPHRSPFATTVLQIHSFFRGAFDLSLILQAIHACAGDYRAVVVKLAQGFAGHSLLSDFSDSIRVRR